jgi:F-type H+-transporting ATPase subunit b
MNINLTLIGQMISFGFFVWFCMRYVWPPIINAINERENKIRDSLHSAQLAKKELDVLKNSIEVQKDEARVEISNIMERGKAMADEIILEAKNKAKEELLLAKTKAEDEVRYQYEKAKEDIKEEIKKTSLLIVNQFIGSKVGSGMQIDDEFIESKIKELKEISV